jgi:hypothetical protein
LTAFVVHRQLQDRCHWASARLIWKARSVVYTI